MDEGPQFFFLKKLTAYACSLLEVGKFDTVGIWDQYNNGLSPKTLFIFFEVQFELNLGHLDLKRSKLYSLLEQFYKYELYLYIKELYYIILIEQRKII